MLLLLFFCFLHVFCNEFVCNDTITNVNEFKWIAGNNIIGQVGVYGTKGIYSPSNVPGSRQSHTSTLYNNTMIIFGGNGYDNSSSGRLNDVWQFDFNLEQFRWISGSNKKSQVGVYGTKGNYSTSNVIGAREGHTSILNGNIMMIFGGFGYDTLTTGYLNDVWQYNFTLDQFKWIAGNNIRDQVGIYGIKGNYSLGNVPGSRYYHTSILYENTMIIFGGDGFDNSSNVGFLNDVWQIDFSINQFRWIAGNNVRDQLGVYGTKGSYAPSNVPGSRYHHTSILCNGNTMIIFGGLGYDNSSLGVLNDVWGFNILTNEFAWIAGNNIIDQFGVYGIKSSYSPSNVPGGRVSHTSLLFGNTMIIFGGVGYDVSSIGHLNDIWQFDISINQFRWISGSNLKNQISVYGTKGIYSPSNIIGGRRDHTSILLLNGKTMIIFGGIGYDNSSSGFLNDVWQYKILFSCYGYDYNDSCACSSGNGQCIAQDTCCCKEGFFGLQCEQVNISKNCTCPLLCYGIIYDNIYVCGSHGICIVEDTCECEEGYSGLECDKFNGIHCNVTITNVNEFRWIAGNNTGDKIGFYGIKGVYSSSNVPGSRDRHTSLLYGDTMIVFGGDGYTDNLTLREYLNDIWQYDFLLKQFRWITGSNSGEQLGNYGIKGVYSTINLVGGRRSHTSNLYNGDTMIIFGGVGLDNSSFSGSMLNDVWQFDFISNQSIWIAGSNIGNQVGVYGTKGDYSSGNVPGSREKHTCILYVNNTMIIFGGSGYDNTSLGRLNDIWQFNILTNEFVWIAGNNIIDQFGVYGTKDFYSASNVPGSRRAHTSLLYGDTMIIFGGSGYDNSSLGRLNDIWQYDFILKQFRWIAGSNKIDRVGIYGIKGSYSPDNVLGGRYRHTSFLYGNTIIIFGGSGYDTFSTGLLNDIWQFDISTKLFRWIAGNNTRNQDGVYGTKGIYSQSNVPGSREYHTSIFYGDTMITFGGHLIDDKLFNDVWQFNLKPRCFGYDYDDSCVSSSGNGQCIALDTCCCNPEFFGLQCENINITWFLLNYTKCKESLDQCNETLGNCVDNFEECEENLYQCNETLGNCTDNFEECKESLDQCNETLGNCTDNFEELVKELSNCYNIVNGWMISFIVIAGILILLLFVGFILLPFFLFRRPRYFPLKEAPTRFEMKDRENLKLGPDVFF